jgi:hypothetical protein
MIARRIHLFVTARDQNKDEDEQTIYSNLR